MTTLVTYPCPVCHAPADLSAGCSGCGRAPDPDAAEVVRLNAELAELTPRVEAARLAYQELADLLRETRRRRDDVAARVRLAVFRRDVPPAAPGSPVAVAVPEAKPVTVQNALFALGGILVGAAAIVFAGVAWATYGQVGRAAILAAVTAVFLAVPPVADRRGLRATAETFAAVGMLLVLLDGYAAWYVDLLGVGALPGFGYAALVCGVVTLVGVAYGAATGLTAPRIAACAAAQPVLPLVVAEVGVDAAGWAYAFAAVAAVDLVLAWWLRGPVRVVAWVGYGVAQLVAGLAALVALLEFGAASPVWAVGVPAVAAAVLLVAAGAVARLRWVRLGAAALVVLALAAAVLRPVAQLRPSVLLVVLGAVVLGLALLALPGRWLPAPEATGVRWGVLAVAALASPVVIGLAAAVGLSTVAGVDPPSNWQAPAAAALVALAVAAAVPRAWWSVVGALAAPVVVLALPAGVPSLTGWPVSMMDLAVAAVLLLVPLAPRGRLAAAGSAAVLVGHALLVALDRPTWLSPTLAAVMVLALTVAAWRTRAAPRAAARPGPAGPPQDPASEAPVGDAPAVAAGGRAGGLWFDVDRVVAGVALTVGLLAWPATAATTLWAADTAPEWWARAGMAAAALLLPVAVVVGRARPALSGYALTALAVAAAVSGVWPDLAGLAAADGVYPSLALVLLAAATNPSIVRFRSPHQEQSRAYGTASLRDRGGIAIAAMPPAALLLVGVLPAVAAVLLAPFEWLSPAAWTGAPAGVGLSPYGDPTVHIGAASALLLTAVAAALVHRAAAIPPAALGLVTVLAAAGAPWPMVPAATLALGVALAVLGLTRAGGRAARATAVPLGVLLALAGTAGLCATPAGTLTGLGVLAAAATVVGAAGSAVPARAAGWVVAVLATAGFAVAATRAADLPLARAAYPLVGVAALALALAAVRRRRDAIERDAVDATAFLVAVLALLLTYGEPRHAAAVCTLFGAVAAARAVLPGEPARVRFALVAAGSELLAWWILLAAERVAVPEAYTLPAAALALVAGHLALRRRPQLGSWVAYGPGLAAALLPTLASVLVQDTGDGLRRLLLGAGALAAVLAGSALRRQSPVVLGGGTLLVLAAHETVVWDLLPRWAYLAVGGLLLIAVAMTYERRLRDLRRLRGAIARMS